MKKVYYSKIFIFIFILSFFAFNHFVLAQILPEPSGENGAGDYQLNDLIVLLGNVSIFILGISGSAALLAFVVGGFYMILSAGNSDMINKGKQAIIGAIIGLAIVFFSFTIIDFTFKSLGYKNSGEFGKWYEVK